MELVVWGENKKVLEISPLTKKRGWGIMRVESRFVKRRFGNTQALVFSDHALLEALKSVFPEKYEKGFLKKKHGIIEA